MGWATDPRPFLDELPAGLVDVYFTPEYLSLHRFEGEPATFTHAAGGHRFVLPGLVVPIDAHHADFQTPNGYGGPLVSPDAPPAFVEEAWGAFSEAARERGIVAAFLRLHPLLASAQPLPPDAERRLDRQTVYASLEGGVAGALARAESRFRNMVSRGTREGAAPRWNEADDWRDFQALYDASMDRLGAPARLRFDATYFAALRALPGTELVALRDAAGLVASTLFLSGPRWAHYHLASRRDDAPNFAASILLHAGLERAAARGLEGMHLGGGASPSPDDGVFKFKRSLGGQLLDFHVALVKTDALRFDALVDAWAQRAGARPSWLLGYRQPQQASS